MREKESSCLDPGLAVRAQEGGLLLSRGVWGPNAAGQYCPSAHTGRFLCLKLTDLDVICYAAIENECVVFSELFY